MLVTFVVIISAGLLSEISSSSDECQLGCSNLNRSFPPTHCILLFNDVVQASQGLQWILGHTDDINCFRATFQAQLEIFCSRECLSTWLTYQTCVKGAFGADLTLTSLCTRHADGTFCPLKILEEATGPGNTFVPPCASGDSCDSDCQASYHNLSSRLGCCGSSWYENPLTYTSSMQSYVRRLFATCNVTLDGPCEAAIATAATATATATASPSMSGATTMVYLSSVLMVAIACLLSLTSVV